MLDQVTKMSECGISPYVTLMSVVVQVHQLFLRGGQGFSKRHDRDKYGILGCCYIPKQCLVVSMKILLVKRKGVVCRKNT